jgi:hypothetical protein
VEMQQDLYLCFIDYTKTFDKVRHEELMNMLEETNINGKYIRIIIKQMYWEQAKVKIEN